MRRAVAFALVLAASAVAILAVLGWSFFRVFEGSRVTGFDDARRELDLLAAPVPLLVLGMGGPSILDRADLAASLWTKGYVGRLVTAGGQGPDESEPESTTLRKALVAAGVAPTSIDEESTSTSTWENLVNARALLEQRGLFRSKVIIATHHYHGRRAEEMAQAAGYDPIVVTTEGTRLDRRVWRFARETLAYVKWHFSLRF